MSPEILSKILLPIGSAVLGVLIVNFKEEIVNFFTSSKKYQHLKGKWACSWKENPSEKEPEGKTFFDILEITKINGKLIKGKGDAKKAGEWEFKGYITPAAITLTYIVKKGSDKSGIIIMKRDEDNNNEMEGAWCQHKKGIIVTGTTTWQKN